MSRQLALGILLCLPLALPARAASPVLWGGLEPGAPGPFPLVVYMPGHGGTPWTHTPTAEYLASHGYAVAISPSQGDAPSGMTFDADGQEQQDAKCRVGPRAPRLRSSLSPCCGVDCVVDGLTGASDFPGLVEQPPGAGKVPAEKGARQG
jgi:hypothetical protein